VEREELAAWLRLALTPEIGRTAARRLLAAFGLPQQIFEQRQAALLDVVTASQAQALLGGAAGLADQLEATLEWLAQTEVPGQRRILTLSDTAYPVALLNTEDPPLMLYVMGDPRSHWPRGIAVVGSRNPTPQGTANARLFARSFAQAGLAVVSGLALGIDGAAHEGALEGATTDQLATIAVVGTGLDRVYPRQHLELARRIAQRGLLVSEYPLGTPPLPANFPQRNRIIAALGDGTLVVEAAVKSGSLITARQAAEQGKEVFAIPGSIHSAQSRGCHTLLKDGAKLVETAQDVLEELQQGAGHKTNERSVVSASAADEGDPLLEAMGFDPVGLDALVARTGHSAAQLQAKLLELEMAGRVGRLPGGLFQRLGAA
jgi:DNA processing protein